MKIIEAMKKIKDLQRKADDIKNKVKQHCAYMSYETPVYADQSNQVSEWLQSHGDLAKEILSLRIRIQKTNLVTDTSIELDGKVVTKTIAEWIHRRRDLSAMQREAWESLDSSRLLRAGAKEGKTTDSQGNEVTITIVRCFDELKRDQMVDLYRSEPLMIDSTLEVVNAATDLIE